MSSYTMLHACVWRPVRAEVRTIPNAVYLDIYNAIGERVSIHMAMATRETLATIVGACMMAIDHVPSERDEVSNAPYESTLVGWAEITKNERGNHNG